MSVLAGIPVLIIRPGNADADIYINHRGFSLATHAVAGGRLVERCPPDRQRRHVIFIRWIPRDQQRINCVRANE